MYLNEKRVQIHRVSAFFLAFFRQYIENYWDISCNLANSDS